MQFSSLTCFSQIDHLGCVHVDKTVEVLPIPAGPTTCNIVSGKVSGELNDSL